MRRIAAALLLLAGCHRDGATTVTNDTAGARIEAAATDAGLIVDPAKATLVGAWARDTDRLCAIPAPDGKLRIGATVDYGEGQSCAASGLATRSGAQVRIDFGPCRIEARFDGDRLAFPAEVPSACERFCTGRASLAAMTVEHLSTSLSEAATLRGGDGSALCPG